MAAKHSSTAFPQIDRGKLFSLYNEYDLEVQVEFLHKSKFHFGKHASLILEIIS